MSFSSPVRRNSSVIHVLRWKLGSFPSRLYTMRRAAGRCGESDLGVQVTVEHVEELAEVDGLRQVRFEAGGEGRADLLGQRIGRQRDQPEAGGLRVLLQRAGEL